MRKVLVGIRNCASVHWRRGLNAVDIVASPTPTGLAHVPSSSLSPGLVPPRRLVPDGGGVGSSPPSPRPPRQASNGEDDGDAYCEGDDEGDARAVIVEGAADALGLTLVERHGLRDQERLAMSR